MESKKFGKRKGSMIRTFMVCDGTRKISAFKLNRSEREDTRDGYHLSYALGRYIAGLTFVRALTGLPIDEIGFIPQGINDDAAAVAIESVNTAIQKPY